MKAGRKEGTPDAGKPHARAWIGIMAHNEEHNMEALLRRVTGERVEGSPIEAVVVVSSGSTDRTDEIVSRLAREDPRIRLITQDRRYGKCAAINLFLAECPPGAYVVLLSGDILPEPGAIGRLLRPLQDPAVGMTGGHPVPVNDGRTFFGFAAHLLWEVHHRVALRRPKLGEAVAFKKVVDAVPEDLAVDEAAIEAAVTSRGLALRYCPEAIILNRGPDNLRDFLKVRRRIQAGHLHLRRKMGYRVSTLGFSSGLRALAGALEWRPRPLLFTVLTCLLLAFGRLLGTLDFYVAGKGHAVWDIAQSTKAALTRERSGG